MTYYDILNVPINASFQEIKQSYKALCKEWHPDQFVIADDEELSEEEKNAKNDKHKQSEEMFSKIAEAYACLSDAEKRQLYNQDIAREANKQRAKALADDGSRHQIVKTFRGGFVPGYQTAESKSTPQAHKPSFCPKFSASHFRPKGRPKDEKCEHCKGGGAHTEPIRIEVECTMEEIFFGCVKEHVFEAHKRVQGRIKQVKDMVEIDILPGLTSGTELTVHERGHEYLNGKKSDLICTVKCKRHSSLIRHYNDLVVERTISLKESLFGVMVEVPTLDGAPITDMICEVIPPESTKVYPGYGMPIFDKPGQRGDLIVLFHVTYPEFTEETLEKLEPIIYYGN